jgi:hypothetical protein
VLSLKLEPISPELEATTEALSQVRSSTLAPRPRLCAELTRAAHPVSQFYQQRVLGDNPRGSSLMRRAVKNFVDILRLVGTAGHARAASLG